MDYLTPELLRVLQPGRRLAVHVKDRVGPAAWTGSASSTIEPFHARCIEHYRKHGFAYLGMITIVTDVVRENAGPIGSAGPSSARTAPGWASACRNICCCSASRQSDRTNGYADVPVVKAKPLVDLRRWRDRRLGRSTTRQIAQGATRRLVPNSGYSRSRWQNDACRLLAQPGDRVLTPGGPGRHPARPDLSGVPGLLSYSTIYDHEQHVALTESVEARMRSRPTSRCCRRKLASRRLDRCRADARRQHDAIAKGREQHLCPLPFDIVDRAIAGWSEPGELVYDPFGGLMTVPLRAVKLGRRGAASRAQPGLFRRWREAAARAGSRPGTIVRVNALLAGELVPEPPAGNFYGGSKKVQAFQPSALTGIAPTSAPADREPCWYCGVRGDIGCSCRRRG
jgi:hypothetical protein